MDNMKSGLTGSRQGRATLTKTACDRKIRPENIIANANGRRLFDLIGAALAVLWKDWHKNMELSSFSPEGFILNGECPHPRCRKQAAFVSVTKPYEEQTGRSLESRWIGALRCIACNGYILGIVRFVSQSPYSASPVYESHYPIGLPEESVPEEIPSQIAEDFKEALKCVWVNAYKATVLMCRRCLQVSCDMEKAEGKDLFHQIDDLAANQRITEPLKKMAHRIRLLGKQGAHGDYSDIDETITKKDAEDAITFMRHYLDHVYVLQAKLNGGLP
jgi:hypothetical protein